MTCPGTGRIMLKGSPEASGLLEVGVDQMDTSRSFAFVLVAFILFAGNSGIGGLVVVLFVSGAKLCLSSSNNQVERETGGTNHSLELPCTRYRALPLL